MLSFLFAALMQANVSASGNRMEAAGVGVCSSASCISYLMRKDFDLHDLCNSLLKQLPKSYARVNTFMCHCFISNNKHTF